MDGHLNYEMETNIELGGPGVRHFAVAVRDIGHLAQAQVERGACSRPFFLSSAAVHSFCHPPDWKSIAQLWTILRASLRTLANEPVKHALERRALENFCVRPSWGVRKEPRERLCGQSRERPYGRSRELPHKRF